jgi:hypothetical protein
MTKKTWRKPPKKLYLIVDKGYSIGHCDSHFSKREALRDLESNVTCGDECESRLYEYVLVEKPIKEVKAK